MAIKFTFKKLPVDADGKAYESLEAFQAAEIGKALKLPDGPEYDRFLHGIVLHKEVILEILELTMDARPAARGMKKPRKNKPAPAAINAALQDQDA